MILSIFIAFMDGYKRILQWAIHVAVWRGLGVRVRRTKRLWLHINEIWKVDYENTTD
jgi:hypothetical protein